MNIFVKAVVLLVGPTIIFFLGVWLMTEWSGRVDVPGQKPLNQRLGYKAGDIQSYWSALDQKEKLVNEKLLLELDLGFPFFYGGALMVSLLFAWGMLGRPFNAVWIVAPVGLAMISDWTENLSQLKLLRSYMNSKIVSDSIWVQVASTATILKLLTLCVLIGFLIWLVAKVVWNSIGQAK